MTTVAVAEPFGSPRRALLGAARLALGTPALVLGASYLGFGALVRASDLTIAMGLFSTVTGWALPGQVALVELYAVGTSLAAILTAVALTNARLLPMALALMPHLRTPGARRWLYYAAAHLVAVTGWVHAMRECPRLPVEERLPFMFGFSGTLWLLCIAMTAAGYHLAGSVPSFISLGLVFLNPIYFMLVLTADLRDPARLRAMAFGALLGPLFHMLDPDWGLLLTGLVAGTAAFLPKLVRGGARG